MKLIRAFFSRFANLFRRHRRDADLSAELDSHLQLHIDENLSRGMNSAEARRHALIKLGGVAQTTEHYRARRGLPFLETLAQDIRYAFRMLRKSPGFTAVAVLTLALGIGANTAIFSFIDSVLLCPLPVRDPQQLVVFSWSAHNPPRLNGHSGYGDCADQTGIGDCSFSVFFFKTIRVQSNTFSGMAAFAGPFPIDVSGNGAASMERGLYVSGDFFSTLGINTLIGRPLTLSDDSPSAPPVIVLSYAYWVRAFAAAPSAVGRTIRLDGTTARIVGVADSHFTYLTPGKSLDFLMPFSLADTVRGEWWGDEDRLSDPADWWIVMLGRLKPRVSLGQAQAAATTIFLNETLHGGTPFFKSEDAAAITLRPAQSGLDGATSGITRALYLTMIIVVFILLIACANVAGLTLARSAARQKEMAVRLALGAGRARILRQLLTESVLLSCAGCALGVLIAVWSVGAFSKLITNGPGERFLLLVAPDWRIFVFTMAVTVATGVLFGLAPALRGSRVDLTPSLKENASSAPGHVAHTSRRLRLGNVLVIAQVALSIVVLISAGLLVRTLRNLRSINPGFDPQNILLFSIDPHLAGYSDQQTLRLYSDLQQHFVALPGVISASYSESALLSGNWSGDDVHIDGAPPKQNVNTGMLPIGLKFFSTMHIPLLAGRDFNSADFAAASAIDAAMNAAEEVVSKANASGATAASSAASSTPNLAPLPVIINETFARKYFPNQNPLGKHISDPQEDSEPPVGPHPGYLIVGIAGNAKYNYLRAKIRPTMYMPLARRSAYFELRAAANPTALVKNVREIVSQAGDNLPITEIRTQTEQIDQILFQERLMSQVSGLFAALALVLACIGLYGLLSYEVARRTREIGIRIALGAQPNDLLRLVVFRGITLAIAGAAVGIGVALGVTRYLQSMLYDVGASDPATLVGVAILLAVVALLACYIPARRAMRVDPMIALRYE